MNSAGRFRQDQLHKLKMGLRHASPERRVREKQILLAHLGKSLHNFWQSDTAARRERLIRNTALIESLSPLAVLQRGYSITRHLPSHDVIKHTGGLKPDDRLSITLARGHIEARVEKISGE